MIMYDTKFEIIHKEVPKISKDTKILFEETGLVVRVRGKYEYVYHKGIEPHPVLYIVELISGTPTPGKCAIMDERTLELGKEL